MKYTYDYPRPMVTVDIILFAWMDRRLVVLLVKRRSAPYRGYWALPGGFVDENEALEKAARRELEEETSLKRVYLEQLYTFGDPGRDPRGHVVSIAYFALVNSAQVRGAAAGSDASGLEWFPMQHLPRLAFDHKKILACGLARLRNKLEYTTMGFQFLARRFTLTELQQVYEAVLGRKVDKRNFRKKILSLKLLRALPDRRENVRHRPARLYTPVAGRFDKLKNKGMVFSF
jgi:8-oxo-dGTP diphosphatase